MSVRGPKVTWARTCATYTCNRVGCQPDSAYKEDAIIATKAARTTAPLARDIAAWAGASPIGLLIWLVLCKYIRFSLAKCTCCLSRLHENIGQSSFPRGDAVLKDERANPLQGHPVSKRQPEFPFKIFGECHHATLDTRPGSRITRMPLGFSTRRGIRSDGDWQAL
jgi:hypothetical protein